MLRAQAIAAVTNDFIDVRLLPYRSLYPILHSVPHSTVDPYIRLLHICILPPDCDHFGQLGAWPSLVPMVLQGMALDYLRLCPVSRGEAALKETAHFRCQSH